MTGDGLAGIFRIATPALPKFFEFGKTSSDSTVDLSKETGKDFVDASQTSTATLDLGSGATTSTAGDCITFLSGQTIDPRQFKLA